MTLPKPRTMADLVRRVATSLRFYDRTHRRRPRLWADADRDAERIITLLANAREATRTNARRGGMSSDLERHQYSDGALLAAERLRSATAIYVALLAVVTSEVEVDLEARRLMNACQRYLLEVHSDNPPLGTEAVGI